MLSLAKNKKFKLLLSVLTSSALINYSKAQDLAIPPDNSPYGNLNISGQLSIGFGAPSIAPVFNGTVTVNGGVFIHAKPIFHNSVVANSHVSISDTAEPVFNSTLQVNNSNQLSIANSAKPEFNGSILTSGSIYLYGSSQPKFNASLVSSLFSIQTTALITFDHQVTSNYLGISPNTSVTFNNSVNLGQLYLFDHSDNNIKFNNDLKISILHNYNIQDFAFNNGVTIPSKIYAHAKNSDGKIPTGRLIFYNASSVYDMEIESGSTVIFSDVSTPASDVPKENLRFMGNTTTSFLGVLNINSPIYILDTAKPTFEISENKFSGIVNVNDTIDIYGISEPQFNGQVNIQKGLNIYDNAKPTFATTSIITINGSVLISGNAEPVFNGSVTAQMPLTITDATKPIFGGTGSLTAGTHLYIQGSAEPVFNGQVNTSGDLCIFGDAKAQFNNKTEITKSLRIYDNAQPVFGENSGVNIQGSLLIMDNSSPTFSDSVNITSYLKITNSATPVFMKEVKLVDGTAHFENQKIVTIDAPLRTDGRLGAFGLGKLIFNSAPQAKEMLIGKNSDVVFSDGVNLDILVKPSEFLDVDEVGTYKFLDNAGIFSFLGATYINQNIGEPNYKLQTVNFNFDAPKDINLKKNIYAYEVSLKNYALNVIEDSTIATGVNSLHSETGSINLGSNTLTLSGKSTLIGDLALLTTFDAVNNKGGNITITGIDSVFDWSQANPVQLILTANSPLPSSNSFYEYELIKLENGAIITSSPNINFTANETNQLIQWSYDAASYKLTGKYLPNKLPEIVENSGASQNTIKIATNLDDSLLAGNSGALSELVSNIGQLPTGTIVEAIQRLEPVEVVEVLTDSYAANENNLSNRIGSHILPNNLGRGVGASGETERSYGTWVSLFYNQTIQKEVGAHAGYNSKGLGVIIGADTFDEDTTSTYGFAFTNMQNKTTYSNKKLNDTGKINSYILSLYGYKELSNNFFVTGIFSGGSNKFTSREKRIISTNLTQYASAEYRVPTYSGEISVGYNINTDTAIVTPILGMGYYWVSKTNYTETGASLANLSIHRDSSYTIEGNLGAEIAFPLNMGNTFVTPEIHAYISKELKKKTGTITVNLIGLQRPIDLKTAKDQRIFYNIGGEINAKSKTGNFEYGFSYECEFAKKYASLVGSIKLRVVL